MMQSVTMFKRALLLILAAVLVITLFPLSASAAEVTLTTNDRAELQATINSAGATATTVIVTKDFSFNGTVVVIPAGAKITIKSDPAGPWKLTQASGRHFEVRSNGTLTLENILLDGGTVYNESGGIETAGGGGVTVGAGTVTMNDGAVIQNCYNYVGGGVNLAVAGGAFTMSGGSIRNNRAHGTNGGGVNITAGSTFAMENAVIENNTASGYGGGVSLGNGTAASYAGMTLGTDSVILNNTATAGSGGINVGSYAKLTMRERTGIYSNSTDKSGGGIKLYTFSELIMESGAAIANNTAKENGGGIGVQYGRMEMSAGALISGNSAGSGGGIHFLYGDMDTWGTNQANVISGLIINNTAIYGGGIGINCSNTAKEVGVGLDGAIVSGNKAIAHDDDVNTYGGGVYVSGSKAFTMTSGIISGNESISYGSGADSYGGGVYLKNSSFSLGTAGGANDGALIDNNAADYMGGGVGVHDASAFTMYSGSISGNQAVSGDDFTYGGGVEVNDSSVFTMKGGIISGNKAKDYSGGVEVYQNSTFNMEGGSIVKNTAPHGGGVSVGYESAAFHMSGGTIGGAGTGNTASLGGGVYVYSSGSMTVASGAISGNSASYGGGVFLSETGQADMDHCFIKDNTATIGDGGGIYTRNTDYANLNTKTGVDFSSNTAATAFVPSGDLDALYPNIQYGSVSAAYSHPLNNYDINTRFNAPLNCHVTFDSLGGSGIPDQTVAFGDRVQQPRDPVKTGYTFLGWWTRDRNGDWSEKWDFDTVLVLEVHGAELVLYAKWEALPVTVSGTVSGLPDNGGIVISYAVDGGAATDTTSTNADGIYSFTVPYDSDVLITPPGRAGYSVSPESRTISVITGNSTGNDFAYTLNSYTVTYDANGGEGGYVDANLAFGTEYTVLSPGAIGIIRQGCSFTGWNTEPNGAGMPYSADSILTISDDVILYAQWRSDVIAGEITGSINRAEYWSQYSEIIGNATQEKETPVEWEDENPSTGVRAALPLCTLGLSLAVLLLSRRTGRGKRNR